jgi:hypothetical protein
MLVALETHKRIIKNQKKSCRKENRRQQTSDVPVFHDTEAKFEQFPRM